LFTSLNRLGGVSEGFTVEKTLWSESDTQAPSDVFVVGLIITGSISLGIPVAQLAEGLQVYQLGVNPVSNTARFSPSYKALVPTEVLTDKGFIVFNSASVPTLYTADII
jgi:hypothetical protein